MSGLINIAKDDTKPLFINPGEVTYAVVSGEGDDAFLAINNAQGNLLHYNAKELEYYNIDNKEAVRKLIAAGAPLVNFQARWPHSNDDSYEVSDNYINPAAVNFVTVSGSNTDKNEKTVTLDVKGLNSFIESLSNTPEESNALVAAIQAAKPLRGYKAEEAYTAGTWGKPEVFYVDPKAVTAIVDNGFQTRVYFGNPGWFLDARPKIQDDDKLAEKFANEIAHSTPEFGGGRDLQDIFNEARARADAVNKAARAKLADGLAAANGNLVSIPSTNGAMHISKENIGIVKVEDGRIIISQQNEDKHDPLMVYYTKDEDRQKVLKALSDAVKTPARRPAKTARPSSPKTKQG
jgi:hypothetical protein